MTGEFVLRFVNDLSAQRLYTGSYEGCQRMQITFASSSTLPLTEIVTVETHESLENQ